MQLYLEIIAENCKVMEIQKGLCIRKKGESRIAIENTFQEIQFLRFFKCPNFAWISICEHGSPLPLKCMNVRIVCVHFLSFCRNLNGNNFACDCNVYNSIVAVITALTASRAATCATPSRVAGVEFYPGGSYEKQPVQDFTCCTYFIKFLDSLYPRILSIGYTLEQS